MEGWKHQTGDAPVVSGPIIVSQAGLEALAGNVSTLFAELPSQSWLRGPLVARLLHGDMPRDDAEAVSGLSRNYISKAPEEQRKKRARLKYVDPFDETAARGRFRAKRVSPADDKRAATAEEWLRKNFVVLARVTRRRCSAHTFHAGRAGSSFKQRAMLLDLLPSRPCGARLE